VKPRLLFSVYFGQVIFVTTLRAVSRKPPVPEFASSITRNGCETYGVKCANGEI
jgi:hypothetical protein